MSCGVRAIRGLLSSRTECEAVASLPHEVPHSHAAVRLPHADVLCMSTKPHARAPSSSHTRGMGDENVDASRLVQRRRAILLGARIVTYIVLVAVSLVVSFYAGAGQYAAANCSGAESSLDGCDLEDFAGLQWATIAFIGAALSIVAVEIALRLRRRSRT
jgi:hypothetical protein